MKKNLFALTIGLVFIFLVVGCSSDNNETTLELGHNAPEDSPSGEAANKLAEIVEDKSDGKLKIDVFPENELGDNRELVEQTSIDGGLDMSMAGLGVLGDVAPEYNFMQIPFLFKDQEHIHSVVESDIGEEIAENLEEEHNILALNQSWDRLPRQISSNEAIMEPKDLKNLKIRPGTKGATEGFKLLGAKPTDVPLDEVYLSLQNKIIDSAELPADYMVDNSVSEVNSQLNLTNHTYGTQFVAINSTVFSELPEEMQDILEESIEEAEEYNNKLTKEEEEEFIDTLEEEGMEVNELTEEQHEAFRSEIDDDIEELEELWPETEGLGERIKSFE